MLPLNTKVFHPQLSFTKKTSGDISLKSRAPIAPIGDMSKIKKKLKKLEHKDPLYKLKRDIRKLKKKVKKLDTLNKKCLC